MFCYVTGTIAQVKVCMHCGCDISIKKLEPNMLKNLLTIPSSTSQKVTLFCSHTGISAYYSFFLFFLSLFFSFNSSLSSTFPSILIALAKKTFC